MKYYQSVIVALSLLAPTSAAWAVDQAEPLACDSNNPTYYPRGDHWARDPSGGVREYHIQKDGSPKLSLTTVQGAIDEAFNYWTSLTCSNDGNNKTPLNVAWKRGSDWSSKDRGDDVDSQNFNHVIYFITDSATWQKNTGADSLTIALATNLRFTSTGYVVTSDIEFNNANFEFRVNGVGCNASQSSPLCYDLTMIATHEVGHWFGFNHINCLDSVMYPTATTSKSMGSKLPEHEAMGACKVYNPLPKDSNYTAQWGEECSANSQCPGGTCIVEHLDKTTFGWCSKKCAKDSDCPEAYVCETSKAYDASAAMVQFCKPGHRWDSSEQEPTDYSSDLCRACNTGADCASELCISDSSGTQSYCSTPCTPGASELGCPSGYSCLELDSGSGACWPTSGECENSSADYCGLNEKCWDYNNTPADVSDDTYCSCASGLLCFAFRNFGECVPACGDGLECPGANHTCCYAIDENGNCQQEHSAGQYGGCFDIRSENETCLRGDEAICGENLLCAQLESSVADNCGLDWSDDLQTAKCYQLCSADDQCATGQTCNLCLEVSSGVGLCWPPDPTVLEQKRPLGAACKSDDQCASEWCWENDGKKACSQKCNYYTASGCPAATVNDLGLEFTCEQTGTMIDGMCWPKNGPVAVDGDGSDEEDEVYGCNCRQGQQDPLDWMVFGLLACWAWRRRNKTVD